MKINKKYCKKAESVLNWYLHKYICCPFCGHKLRKNFVKVTPKERPDEKG